MTCFPGELYEVQESDFFVRVWKGQWDEKDEDVHLGDIPPGESFLVMCHGTYDDTWVLTKHGVGIIEGVSDLILRGAIRLSRTHEGSGATP